MLLTQEGLFKALFENPFPHEQKVLPMQRTLEKPAENKRHLFG
jgi:hypothetical protein